MEGDAYLWDPGCFFPAQMAGLVKQHVGADSDIFSVSTAVGQTKDFVADFEVLLDLGSEGFDSSAELDAQDLPALRGNGILALALQQVHAVETEGLNLHYGLRLSGLRFGDVGDEEGVGIAGSSFDVCGAY